MSDISKIKAKLKRLERYVKKDMAHVIGMEAVNDFQESFRNQGFTDSSLKKWKEVKRRTPSSS
jgi:glycine/serine hydroxymethyltransferase